MAFLGRVGPPNVVFLETLVMALSLVFFDFFRLWVLVPHTLILKRSTNCGPLPPCNDHEEQGFS